MADTAHGGGSDWEVVSLTASTYAAAPGPIPVSPIHDAADKAESPLLLLPNHPAPPAHFFMSQHFNLPAKQPLFSTHLENNNGSQELEESGPAVADGDASDDADHLNMPRPENYCQSAREDALVLASPAGNGLQVEGGGGGGDEVQQTTTGICSLPDATAGSDAAAAADATATLPAPAPAPAAPVPVAAPSGGGNAAQAWWEKTYSFPRQDGNGGTQPLAFRFVFVAGKLQIQEDHLSPVPGFGQTQTISCAGNEPLGQVKVSMLDGGSPVSQQG